VFFGLSGSLNDINVLDQSPIFHEALEGRTPKLNYTINGHNYNLGYYLINGIYPNYATFVKSIPLTQGAKNHFICKTPRGG
jgi:Plant transposon protein